MGTTSQKIQYLGETKSLIKDSINLTGAGITNEDTFRSYAVKLRDGLLDIINNGTIVLYNNFPKVSGTGSNISLSNTLEAPMFMNKLDGDTLQNGTPTPSTPVDIQSAEGIQNISVYGKNLFNKNTITSGKLVSRDNGNLENSSDYGASDYIPMEENTTYTLDSNTFNRWYSACYDKNKNYIGYVSNSNTFTTIANTKYMRFTVYLNKIDEAMIVKENTLPTTYEPYQSQNYEVNLEGKNLFDKDDTFTYGYIDNSGNYVANNTIVLFDSYIEVNGNNYYTFSAKQNLFNLTIVAYDSSKTFIQRNLVSSNKVNTWNLPSNCKYVRLQFNYNNQASSITQEVINNLDLQFEKDNTATSYVPYRLPIKLYNGDYITGTPDNWSIVRNNGAIVLNGTESMGYNSSSEWLYVGISQFTSNYKVEPMKSNYFTYVANMGDTSVEGFGINNALAPTHFVFRNLQLTSKNDWITWLSTHNTEIVYKLTTPTTEQITDTYLISQLNALYNAKSYNGQTNISVDGQLPMILEVSALKDEI